MPRRASHLYTPAQLRSVQHVLQNFYSVFKMIKKNPLKWRATRLLIFHEIDIFEPRIFRADLPIFAH